MKTCSSCKQIKDFTEFTKRAASKDGLASACRECLIQRDKVRYEKEKEYRSIKGKIYRTTDTAKKSHEESAKKWRELNKIKRSVHVLVGNYVKNGRLIKPKACESCSVEDVRIHAHHEDYAFPLSVRWLCSKCHTAWHKEHGAGKNG